MIKRHCIFAVSGLHFKHITIVNDDSKVVTMMLQVAASHSIVIQPTLAFRMRLQVEASPMIIILTTLEAPSSVILTTLENIYRAGITYDRHLRSSKYFYSAGHRFYITSMVLTLFKLDQVIFGVGIDFFRFRFSAGFLFRGPGDKCSFLPGNTNWRGRGFSTVELLMEVACFVTKWITLTIPKAADLNKLVKKVNCTKPSLSVRVPCLNSLFFFVADGGKIS
jgi:hypothetical protein